MNKDKRARTKKRIYKRPAPAPLPGSELVSIEQILAAMNISASTWWDGIKKGKFPKGIKLGSRTTRWRTADVRQLIQQGGAAA